MSSPYAVLLSRPHVVAEIVRGALEAEGLDVKLERNGLGVVYGLQHGPWATRVLVARDDLPRARELLAEIEGTSA